MANKVSANKDEIVKVRVSTAQKRELIAAAKRDGADDLSSWLRALALNAARAGR